MGYFRLGWICQYICSVLKKNPQLRHPSPRGFSQGPQSSFVEILEETKLEGEAFVYLTNAIDLGT